jgi:hypothetical protein
MGPEGNWRPWALDSGHAESRVRLHLPRRLDVLVAKGVCDGYVNRSKKAPSFSGWRDELRTLKYFGGSTGIGESLDTWGTGGGESEREWVGVYDKRATGCISVAGGCFLLTQPIVNPLG